MRKAWPSLFLCSLIACGGDSPIVPVPAPGCPASVSLRRGEVQSFSGATAVSCIGIPAASETQEYLFVAANATSNGSDVWTYQVGSALGASSASPSVASAPSRASEAPDFRSAFEDGLRRNERALLGGRSIGALGRAAAASFGAHAMAAARSAPRIGDIMSYRVGDAASTDLCTRYATVQAVVKAVGTRSIVAIDLSAPAGFSDDDFKAVAAEFDQVIYPVDAQWFGNATDVNADQRITILYTPIINRLSPPGASFVGGFFFLSDLLPRSIPAEQWRCDASNEQEIIYLLTPDPNGTINGNRHSLTSAMEATRGVLAHELQHMINQGIRQTVTRTARLEVPWLNEGLSHFAEEAVGRAARGYGDFRKLDWTDILVDLDDFDAFFRQNLIRLRSWMERPDLYSPIGQNAGTQLAPRGAAWALLRYSIDQYAQGDAKAFVRALVAGPEVDVQNLEARARVSFGEILPGFLVASAGDVAPGATRYGFGGMDLRDQMLNLNGGVYPLRMAPLSSQGSGQSPSGSASYFTLARPAGAAATTYRMRSASGGAVEHAGARVYVFRVK